MKLAFSKNKLYHISINDCQVFWNVGWQLINSKPSTGNYSVPQFWLKHYADMLQKILMTTFFKIIYIPNRVELLVNKSEQIYFFRNHNF